MNGASFNPYVGLRPFRADENLIFFGRDDQTMELLQRLHEHRFVAVVGGSGSGKSSLIRAGLIPALKGGYLVEDSSKWLIATMKPGKSPMYNFAESILRQVEPNTDTAAISALVKKLKREGTAAIINIIAPLKIEQKANFFLLIDQFEELFRFSMEQNVAKRKTEAIDFVNMILDLSTQSHIPFYVVLTMRSDFIGDCAQFHDLPKALNKSQYLVPRLNRQQLKKIIEGPTKLFGGKFSSALTIRLINDLGKVKDELPLVQHALMRIWDYETNVNKGGELDLEDYTTIGGIEQALSQHADEALKGMSKTDLLIAKELFQALTAIDENGRKIRRPLLLSDLKSLTGVDEEKLLDIIDHFIRDQRSFLIIENAGDTNDKVIDISHESLIRQWETLNKWVDEESEAASYYLQLAEATRLNKLNKKDFLTGSELQLALDWQLKFKPTAVWGNRYREGFDESMAYLKESENERTRLRNIEKSRRKKQRILVFVIMFLIGLFAVYAIIDRNNAVKEKTIATNKKNAFELHFQAKVLESKDPTTALRLEEEALKLYDYPVFRKSALALIHNYTFYKIIAKDTAGFSTVDISPIHNTILTGSADGMVSLWDLEGRSIVKFKGHEGGVSSVGFSPDGKSIITGGTLGGTARSWDLEGGLISTFEGHRVMVSSVAYTPDGKSILTSSMNGIARLWDLDGNKIREIELQSEDEWAILNSVVLAPDGRSLVAGYQDGSARLWDLDGSLITEFKGHIREIYCAAFAPDGKSILTGSWEGMAQLWDLEGNSIQEFKGIWGAILSVAFSPDGKSILTGSFDNTIHLWDMEGNMIREFIGHKGDVISVAFTLDGKSIVSGSNDGTIHIWDLEEILSTVYKEHKQAVRSVIYAPDGKSILTGSHESAQLWDLEGNKIQEWKAPGGGMIYSAVFAPDGKSILTGAADSTAQLWDLKGNMLKEFKGHKGNVRSVAFAPDGNFFVTGSWDKTVRLWDLDGRVIREFKTEKGITSVVFSHDGKSILAGTFGKSILWDLDGNLLVQFVEPSELFVNGVAFGPDDQFVLTGSNDHGARLWNLAGEIIMEFIGPRGAVRSVAFAPDGKSVLTGTAGGTARLWDLRANILKEFKGDNRTVFSVAYSPDGKSILMGSGVTAYLMKRIQLKEFLNGSIEPLSPEQKKKYGIE